MYSGSNRHLFLPTRASVGAFTGLGIVGRSFMGSLVDGDRGLGSPVRPDGFQDLEVIPHNSTEFPSVVGRIFFEESPCFLTIVEDSQ